jgi:hypothetical protein
MTEDEKKLAADEALNEMAKEGVTAIDALRRLVEDFGLGLGIAKELLLEHPAWQLEAESNKCLQKEIEADLDR